MVQLAVDIYSQIVALAVPVALVFEIGNLIVCTVLRVGFGGKLWVGR